MSLLWLRLRGLIKAFIPQDKEGYDSNASHEENWS
jgi:hypothetical protein